VVAVSAVPLLVLIAAGRTAAGPAFGPITVRLDVDAPARCADADTFYAALSARVERLKRATSGETGVRLKVRLTRAGSKVHGDLWITDEHSEVRARQVDGVSCEQVVAALSLTAALALDPSANVAGAPGTAYTTPTASLSAPPAPAASTGRAESGAPPSATPAPPTGTAPTPTVPESRPPSTLNTPLPSTPPPWSTPPSTSATPTPPASTGINLNDGRPDTDVTVHAPVHSSLTIDVGARAVAATVVSPFVGLGGTVFARFGWDTSDALGPALSIAGTYAPNDLLQSHDVVIRWSAVALTACPGWGLRQPIILEACAQFMGGWLSANDRAITNPQSARRSWWSAGAVVHGRVPIGAGFNVDLELGAAAPLVYRRFTTTTPDRVVAHTPRIAILGSLGISRSF
jgi:hypothetical protein